MRVSVWVGTVLWVLVGMVQAVAVAQTPLAQPDLDLWRAGSVTAMAATADGGRIVGGEFHAVGGMPRRHLARLLPDGSVDPAWSVDVDGPINALAVDGDGRIYVAGEFGNIGGAARNKLARLSSSGQVDAGWNPAPTDPQFVRVFALLISGGNLYVAGRFTSIAGQARSHLAKFATASGAIDPAWAPVGATFSGIRLLAADGQFLYFESNAVAGQPLARALLAGNGVIDANWAPTVDGGVQAALADGAGTLYIGGSFTTVQGVARLGLARVSTSAGAAVDPNWNPSLDGYATAFALDASGLYVGGRVRALSGQPRANLARVGLIGSGAVDPAFAPEIRGGTVQTLLPGGGVLHVGGNFSEAAGQPRSGLASVVTSNAALVAGTPAAERSPGVVNAVLPMPDGGTLIGGRFTRAGGLPRLNLMRLTPQGVPDPAWQADVNGQPVPYRQPAGEPGGFDYDVFVSGLERDAEGRVYVFGTFDRVAGIARANIGRISASGQVDAGWNPGADGLVQDVALDDDGTVYLGGNFETVGGLPRVGLAKLSGLPGAAVDPQWLANMAVGTSASALLLDGSGALFVAGYGLESINGVECCLGLVKLATAGSGARDPLWNARLGGSPRYANALALGRDGMLYIAGSFSIVNGFSGLRDLARVSASGTGALDTSWIPETGFQVGFPLNAIVLDGAGSIYVASSETLTTGGVVRAYSTAGSGAPLAGWPVAADALATSLRRQGGSLWVGGGFTTIGGVSRRGLAAISIDPLFGHGFD